MSDREREEWAPREDKRHTREERTEGQDGEEIQKTQPHKVITDVYRCMEVFVCVRVWVCVCMCDEMVM